MEAGHEIPEKDHPEPVPGANDMGHSDDRTLRCDEVIRGITAPDANDDSSWLAGHVLSCPKCASFARDNARLDRLWESTRPVEPSSATWDAVWTGISAGLDRAAQPASMPISAATRWWARRSVVLALSQAAMLLLAVTFWWSRPGPSTVVQAEVPRFEISEGQFSCIRLDGDKFTLETIEIAQGDARNSVDPGYELLGMLEGMAN